MRGAAGAAVAAVVVVAIGAGLFILGRPADERARRLDERRVEDLRRLAGAVDLYWTRHRALPASTADLDAEPGISVPAGDPDTRAAYEYRALTGARYELCATFAGSTSPASSSPAAGSTPRAAPRGDTFWAHDGGRHCFAREAREIR